jgi:hypothetical protein
MADRKLQLPNLVINGHAYGRNINHDQRSLRYKVAQTATAKSVEHDIVIPILNQANIGKCVAETGAEFMGWDKCWALISDDLKKALSTVPSAEQWTSALYHELTATDDFPGTWQPDDTGSDGLTLGKTLTRWGLLSGYQHVTTIGEAEAAIQQQPFAIGTVWLEGMETPRKDGTVKVSGRALGGHEYLCFKRDAERDLWWFRNHWTTDWGLKGLFAYDTPGLQKLMDQQGDITVPVILSQPKPEPTPVPTPAPAADQPDWGVLDPFVAHPRGIKVAQAAAAELSRWKGTLQSA